MDNEVLVPEWLLISAVRYALGRSSHVVPETINITQHKWGELSANVREVILRDVEEFVTGRDAEDYDVGVWVRFLRDVRGNVFG